MRDTQKQFRAHFIHPKTMIALEWVLGIPTLVFFNQPNYRKSKGVGISVRDHRVAKIIAEQFHAIAKALEEANEQPV